MADTLRDLDMIRETLTEEARAILDFVWQQASAQNLSTWPSSRSVNIKFKAKDTAALLAKLPAESMIHDGDWAPPRYRLSFLGVLLSSAGPRCEDLLVEYLDYVRKLAAKDPETSFIKSPEVAAGMNLEREDVMLLGQGIYLSALYGSRPAGGGPTWACDVPGDLPALMTEPNLRQYVRNRALRDLATSALSAEPASPAASVSVAKHSGVGTLGAMDVLRPSTESSPHSDILLGPEQVALLTLLVEASRSVQPDQRQAFGGVRQFTGSRVTVPLSHPGIPPDWPGAYPGDLTQLANERLINLKESKSGVSFDVTPLGQKHYEWLKAAQGSPIERVTATVHDYIDAVGFASRHALALSKWKEAERTLWGPDSADSATTVGHLCREAHQAFGVSLRLLCRPELGTPEDSTKTKNHIRSALEAKSSSGEKVNAVATALRDYWEAVVDLAQRQEHGKPDLRDPLTWEDSRRLVFVTLLVMTELDRVCQLPTRPN